MPGDFCITWHERDYSGLKVISTRRFCALPSAVLLLAIGLAGPRPEYGCGWRPRPGDQRAGNGIRTLLGETHVQVVTTRAVGITNHVNRRFRILFQHHCHAGQGVSACRFQVALLLSKVTLFGILRIMLSPLRVTLTPVPRILSRSFASCTSM